jgi:hypothetical protein
MDPMTRATITWVGWPPDNEEEVYYLARQDGYIFPALGREGLVGSLPGWELEDIARYPPIVPWSDYREYRQMSLEDLMAHTPGILDIMPNVSRDDLFFIRTRGWHPDRVGLQEILSRIDVYNNLKLMNQQLFDRIYGDKIGFATTTKVHPLEDTILAYDAEMGLSRRVRDLAVRVGMQIPVDQDPDVYLYDRLNQFITLTNEEISDTEEAPEIQNQVQSLSLNPYTRYPPIQDVLDLDWDGFKRLMEPLISADVLEIYGQEAYDNRTTILMNLLTTK